MSILITGSLPQSYLLVLIQVFNVLFNFSFWTNDTWLQSLFWFHKPTCQYRQQWQILIKLTPIWTLPLKYRMFSVILFKLYKCAERQHVLTLNTILFYTCINLYTCVYVYLWASVLNLGMDQYTYNVQSQVVCIFRCGTILKKHSLGLKLWKRKSSSSECSGRQLFPWQKNGHSW